MKKKEIARSKRHKRIRKKIAGSGERPRLCVHRSAKNLYVQIIDDNAEKTLLSASTLEKDFKAASSDGKSKVDTAKNLGSYCADKMKKKGIEKVAFDRGGYLYHGRIKALADALRESGVQV